MRWVAAVLGVSGVLLGGLWLLQGTGLVQVRPILCFADCAPVQGPSLGWAVSGLLLASLGVVGIRYSIRGRARG